MITNRVEKLLRDVKSSTSQIIVDASEQQSYIEIMLKACAGNSNSPAVLRRAEFLNAFASEFPISINPEELIVGSQRFMCPYWSFFQNSGVSMENLLPHTLGHIIVDYARVLRLGVNGLINDVRTMPEGDNKHAFLISLNAFSVFIRRHGFKKLATLPPENFKEALQLLWFTQIFLHAESNAGAISFGRLDQYLSPFLEADLKNGTISELEASELICCFFLKCCEGDESQNLTIGGTENKLSILLMEAMTELGVWQPSISVRINENTTDEFWNAASNLCAIGIGMPSFFNDHVVISSLEKLDIPRERAADWGVVGCYEASPQGDCYPLTIGGGFALPDLLWEFLNSRDEWSSFKVFITEFKNYFANKYENDILPGFERKWKEFKGKNASPFESVCVSGCVTANLAVEEGGPRFNLFGVNILGLGTLIDSLLAIKTIIFDEKHISFEQIRNELRNNFPDQKLLLKCRNLPGKYGTDSEKSGAMAGEMSSFIANEVLDHPMSNGVRPYPGFFWFAQDVKGQFHPSPDGRTENDRVSYGCGPGILNGESSITSILNSAACLYHTLCACGNPLTLSLGRNDVTGKSGVNRLRQIITSYFKQGGFHLQFNIVDAEKLENAKKHPNEHSELTVRISGFSARFTMIDESWQDAIIERTKQGM